MRVKTVMGNQEISVMWKILRMLYIFMSNLYLMPPPLILVKIVLMIKVTNLFCMEVTSQITIHPLQ